MEDQTTNAPNEQTEAVQSPAEGLAAVTAPPAAEPVAPPESAEPTPPTTSETAVTGKGGGKGSKTLLFVTVAAIAVLLLSGGLVFGVYLPNKPTSVYKSSLSNSGKALDTLTSYAKAQSKVAYKSVAVKGDFNLKSGSITADGTLSGKVDKQGVGDALLSVDLMGQKVAANVRSVKKADATSPDIYVQFSGVKSLLDSQSLGSLDTYDGKWLEIDHTLVSSAGSTLKKSASSSVASVTKLPTTDQVNDAIARVSTVNKQYIFTTNNTTAVLMEQQFVGKETKNGRSVDHFKVGYSKANLKAYVTALGTALDASSLNDWSKQANDGKSLSQVIDIAGLQTSVDHAQATYTFDLWADTGTKLVQSVQFADPKDPSTTFVISQNYTGGSKYPFSITSNSKDMNVTLTLSVDTSANTVGLGLKGSGGTGTSTLSGSVNLSLTPSTSDVSEIAPAGATPVSSVIQQLFGGLSF